MQSLRLDDHIQKLQCGSKDVQHKAHMSNKRKKRAAQKTAVKLNYHLRMVSAHTLSCKLTSGAAILCT